MSIILFYQHIDRELYSIRKLELLLKSNGHKVFVYSIDFELDQAIKCSKVNKIDIIVTPYMYHNNNYEEHIPIIKNNPGVKIINLHSEQIYAPFSRVAVLPAKGVASDNVFHFCWSEFFKHELLECGINENQIFVTGNMRNDEAYNVKYTKHDLAKHYKLNEKKPWIIFAENRNFVMTSDGNNNSFRRKGVSEQEIEERMEFYRSSLIETIKDLNSINPDFFNKYELIYRAHPGFQGNMGVTNKGIHEIADLSIYEWLHASEVCLVWNSTVAFESDVMNVPVFICSPVQIPQQYQTIGLSNYPYIQFVENILNYSVEDVLAKQKEKKNFQLFLGTIDGNATNNVAEAIEEVYKSNVNYSAITFKYNRFYHIRKYFSVKLLRVLISLHLFEKLKYPRSAYQRKKDIPFYSGNMI